MKRILLACCLMAVSGTAVMAQSAKTAPVAQATNPKQTFASLVNEVEANLTRSNGEIAKNDYFKLAGMMQDRMGQKQKALEAASSETEKKAIANSLKTEQQLYTDAKMLSTDMVKNQKEIVAKLRAFLDTY